MARQIYTRPVQARKTRRPDNWRGLTSMKAGVITPVAFFPLLREDSARGRIALQVRMAEALHTIINPIRVRASVYLVPKSAMTRFNGSMEAVNCSYMNVPLPNGDAPAPWKIIDGNALADDAGHEIYDKLGIHYKTDSRLDADLVESYQAIVNWRRAAVSAALPKNVLTDHALAPAFWDAWKFNSIKPSFDAAMMEGAVPVHFIDGSVPIKDMAYSDTLATETFRSYSDNSPVVDPRYVGSPTGVRPYVDMTAMQGNISLADIKVAHDLQVMSKMRERYHGIPQEYLIDMLMRGLRVPEYQLMEPVLIGFQETTIGQTERYATDGASLDTSVTNGVAQLSLPINTPAIEPGGLIMVLMEIVPEQLYERMNDYWLEVNANGDRLDEPDWFQDYNDPQKVQVVTNRRADVRHGSPDQIFGYEPLNFEWIRNIARVGGKYKRPPSDDFVEDRQRIWAVEKVDPTLSEDFYLCPQPFPHTVFADAEADPFEVIVVGSVVMTGLTQFGAQFEEDGDHYEKLLDQMDLDRVQSLPPGTVPAAEEQSAKKPMAKPKGDEDIILVEPVDAMAKGGDK
jgi:hypothetical protein